MGGMKPSSVGVAGVLARLSRGASQPGIVSAYLFGSHASGRPHRESDVDVGVLLDWEVYQSRPARFDARIRLASELSGRPGRSDVDVVILNDAPPLLARRIVMEGRRILCLDAEADHAFRRDIQLRAADVAPFLRRMARLKLAAIQR
ncbi:MAG: type VII toxin-antitoxin system MntA family adenylyltransferase antitoxin [Candidatus Rokuibacteriota bacterium]